MWQIIVGELLADWRAKRTAKRQITQATGEYRAEQARSDSAYKREWELKALEGAGLWMRRVTLALFSVPLVWAYFDPVGVVEYFETLKQMPEWYLIAYGSMLGTVWGAIELRQWKAGA